MVANEWRVTAEWYNCSNVQWRSAIVALVGLAVEIRVHHSIGDNRVGDWRSWHLVNWVNLLNDLTGESERWTSRLVNLLRCPTGDFKVTPRSLLLGPSSSRFNYQELEKQYQWGTPSPEVCSLWKTNSTQLPTLHTGTNTVHNEWWG